MDILLPVLFSAPVWLVLLVGIVYAVLTIGAHRTVSILGAMALSGFLLLDLTGTLVWALYEWFVVAEGGEGVPVYVTQVFWLVQSIIHALFLGLAIAVAARGREPHGG
ncbi:MAG: hypothetical protein H6737_26385 [Alphaproteobacteria bacterium]|nr:hypothetical protein [Alphaproteobacteria bacterium]